jgi:hypothetical protein
MKDSEPSQSPSKVGIMNLLQSVFAAALGVQSAKNRERDFQQGSAGVFIAAGLLFTVLFIGGVVAVVQMVIATH